MSNIEYSIIIPYRNREKHLEIMLPRLIDIFQNKKYEIIVSEQNDNDNFRIACVENIGVKYSSGNTIILHQVDYYPLDDVSYEVDDIPVLPARKGIFVKEDNKTPRDYLDIPGGYRNWSNEIDARFYGGVIAMKREHFEKINGLNPKYLGWGNEDEDLRERFVWANIPVKRNEVGTFLCLYHEDNGDLSIKTESGKRDFIEGRQYFNTNAINEKNIGYKNLTYNIIEFDCGIDNVRWIKSTNYKIV